MRACGRVRTTLKSTVSSAYCFTDHCYILVTHLDHIHGWGAPYTALLYTLAHMRACTKVGSEARSGAQKAPSDAASPTSPAALPAVLLPSCPPVRVIRSALRLPGASWRPRGPGGGYNGYNGYNILPVAAPAAGRAARQPSSIGPPCASPGGRREPRIWLRPP